MRLNDDLARHVDDVREDNDTSDAEAVRECIRRSRRLDDLEARVAELEADVERLQHEKQQILEQREEHTDLVRAVERERTLQERKAEAGVLTRAKWWLTGMDDDE